LLGVCSFRSMLLICTPALVDVSGLIIYFSVARVVLGGTLL